MSVVLVDLDYVPVYVWYTADRLSAGSLGTSRDHGIWYVWVVHRVPRDLSRDQKRPIWAVVIMGLHACHTAVVTRDTRKFQPVPTTQYVYHGTI